MTNRALRITLTFIALVLWVFWVASTPLTARAQEASLDASSVDETYAEDAWWQFRDRTLTTFVELGPRLTMTQADVGPADSRFLPSATGFVVTAGRWIHPMVALELQGAAGWGRSEALFNGGRSDHHTWSFSGGVRWALPMYITPLMTTHLTYAQHGATWSVSPDNPAQLAAGEDTLRSLSLDLGAGVSGNLGHLTLSLVFGARFNLNGQIDRHLDTATTSSGMTNLDPVATPDFFDVVSVNAELRAGFRF